MKAIFFNHEGGNWLTYWSAMAVWYIYSSYNVSILLVYSILVIIERFNCLTVLLEFINLWNWLFNIYFMTLEGRNKRLIMYVDFSLMSKIRRNHKMFQNFWFAFVFQVNIDQCMKTMLMFLKWGLSHSLRFGNCCFPWLAVIFWV